MFLDSIRKKLSSFQIIILGFLGVEVFELSEVPDSVPK